MFANLFVLLSSICMMNKKKVCIIISFFLFFEPPVLRFRSILFLLDINSPSDSDASPDSASSESAACY